MSLPTIASMASMTNITSEELVELIKQSLSKAAEYKSTVSVANLNAEEGELLTNWMAAKKAQCKAALKKSHYKKLAASFEDQIKKTPKVLALAKKMELTDAFNENIGRVNPFSGKGKDKADETKTSATTTSSLLDEIFAEDKIDGRYILCANGNIKNRSGAFSKDSIDLKEYTTEVVMPIVEYVNTSKISFDLDNVDKVMRVALALREYAFFKDATTAFFKYFNNAFPCVAAFIKSAGSKVPTDLNEELKRIDAKLDGITKFVGSVVPGGMVVANLTEKYPYLAITRYI